MTCKYTAEYWGEDLQLAYFRWTFDSWDASTRSPGYRLSQHVTVSHFMWLKCHQSFCEES